MNLTSVLLVRMRLWGPLDLDSLAHHGHGARPIPLLRRRTRLHLEACWGALGLVQEVRLLDDCEEEGAAMPLRPEGTLAEDELAAMRCLLQG